MAPTFDLDERLQEAKARQLGVDLPVPLHERLEALSNAVYDARHRRPPKVRLLAALILAAPTDPDRLDEMVRAYEGASVRDALVVPPADEDATVIEFPARRPGPRPTGG